MASNTDRSAGRQRIERLEGLIQAVEQCPDPKAREQTQEIVRALLDVHGAGLERILEAIAAAGPTGLAMIDGLAADDLVSSLLLLYGLHPLDLETRVRRGLDKARPALRSHGGNVELLGIVDGVVRLRLQGSCHGCPSSALTLKTTIEEAIYETAPDVTAIEIDAAENVVTTTVRHGDPGGAQRMSLPILSR